MPIQPVAADSVNIAIVLDQFSAKYNELLEFKDKQDFINLGFGVGGPYNKWLRDVQSMSDKHDSDLLTAGKRILFGDLVMLGTEYVSSKGKETEYTKWCHKSIADAIP